MAQKYPETYGEGMICPAYSPDLSPLDFFLWGYTKDRVYINQPKTIAELESAVNETIKSVPADMLQRAIGSFEKRLRMVVVNEGKHIDNILN